MTTVQEVSKDALLQNIAERAMLEVGPEWEGALYSLYTKMAEGIRDERDLIIDEIENEDRYRGREVCNILDTAVGRILDVVEANLPTPTEKPGLTTIYFDLINN